MKISSFTESPANSSPAPFPKPPFQPKLRRYRIRKPVVFDAPAIMRRGFRRVAVPVSSRKLAAGMWHLAAGGGGGGGRVLSRGQIYGLGFQHHNLTEGSTKWNPNYSRSPAKNLLQTQQCQLIQAQARIRKLEASRHSWKTKILYLMIKLYNEPIKFDILTNDLKHALSREKRICEKMRISNSKLLENLAEIALCAKEFMSNYEKERKMRILLEETCRELSKKVEECKAEVEEIKREFLRSRDEIEEERKMMQMAEVWREEQVQIKMFDAKMILEEKYHQMNNLVADLDTFLSSKDVNPGMIEMSEAEVIREAANSVRIDQEDIKEFTFLPLKDHQKNKANELNKKHENLISSKKPKNNISALCKMWKSSLGNEKVVNNPHIIRGIQGYIEWPRGMRKMKKI